MTREEIIHDRIVEARQEPRHSVRWRLYELIRDMFDLPSIGKLRGGDWNSEGVSKQEAIRRLCE